MFYQASGRSQGQFSLSVWHPPRGLDSPHCLARYPLRAPYTLGRWSSAGRRLLLSLLVPEVRGTHTMAGQDPGQPPPPSALLREMSYHYQRPWCFNDRRLASTSQNHQLLEYGPSPSVLATPLPCLTHTPPCKPTCQVGPRGSLQDPRGDSFILIRPYLYYPMQIGAASWESALDGTRASHCLARNHRIGRPGLAGVDGLVHPRKPFLMLRLGLPPRPSTSWLGPTRPSPATFGCRSELLL